MGIFDNALISPLIPKSFLPSSTKAKPTDKYLYDMQGGCGVRVYPNSENREPLNLFWEIESCSVDRSIVDIGGAFSITLLPTEPWDEILEADDFVRIFMGDQIQQSQVPTSAYNFAAGPLDQARSQARGDVVKVPLPGSGWGRNVESNRIEYEQSSAVYNLVMYERMVGKIDRVQRVEEAAGGESSGSKVRYVVTGRSLGAIIQDISLYYNEWLPGLNAINVFFGSNVSLLNSPSEFVKQIISVVLSAVPLPQWQLPKSLVSELNYGSIADENVRLAEENLGRFASRISETVSQNPTSGLENALTELNRLVSEISINGDQNPFRVLSIKGFKPTFGTTFDKSFLNSTTTGLFDLLKHLSNDVWNEMFFDMCPGGNIDGADGSNTVAVPSLVMRQRPYDVTKEMLESTSSYLSMYNSKLDKFPRVTEDVQGFPELNEISKSLLDLDTNSLTIYSREQQTDVASYLNSIGQLTAKSKITLPGGNYIPTAISNETGRANHDRLNAWLTTGDFNRGQQNQTDRVVMSSNGGFKVDADSIRRFGFRIMETSTIYGQPDNSKDQPQDYAIRLKAFTAMNANWYFMNPAFLNGRIVCRFLPDARLGIPIKYFQTRIEPYNPYPKMELFYCQGVSDTYQYGQPMQTTLTVIRGIRYNLLTNRSASLKQEMQKLSSVRERVKKFFGVKA